MCKIGQCLIEINYCSIQSWPRGGLSSLPMVPTTRNITTPPTPDKIIKKTQQNHGNFVEYSTAAFWELTLIPEWISNQMSSNVWDETTYPFPNLNDATVDFWEWICNFVPHFTMTVITHQCWVNNECNYLSMLGLKLNHDSEWDHWAMGVFFTWQCLK